MPHMTAATSQRPESRPLYIPKLTYRNGTSSGESYKPSRLSTSTTTTYLTAETNAHTVSTGVTSPTTSEAPWPRSPGPLQERFSTSTSQRSPLNRTSSKESGLPLAKKKGSRFGGLFAKEPSAAALDQFAAQLLAQNGGKPPANVSSEKMPAKVPKVNSKWDGIPQAVKDKQRLEKERARQGLSEKPEKSDTSSSRSHSAGPSSHKRASESRSNHERRHSHLLSSSKADSPRGRPSVMVDSHTQTKTSIRSSSSSGVSQSCSSRKAVSFIDQTMISPSGTSLPEITHFFPNDIVDAPPVPALPRNQIQPVQQSNYYDSTNILSDAVGQDKQFSYLLAVESMPDHTYFPVASPAEDWPLTPVNELHIHGMDGAADYDNAKTTVLPARGTGDYTTTAGFEISQPPPIPAKSHLRTPSEEYKAFLAGEAAEMELPDEDDMISRRSLGEGSMTTSIAPRPLDRIRGELLRRDSSDSSRGRLGLRPSMLVTTDAAPWEIEDRPAMPASSASNRDSYTSSFRNLHLSRIQQDLDQRPNSSRDRLGLRTSMIKSTGTVPWEFQESSPGEERLESPVLEPTSPTRAFFPKSKTRLSLFSREK